MLKNKGWNTHPTNGSFNDAIKYIDEGRYTTVSELQAGIKMRFSVPDIPQSLHQATGSHSGFFFEHAESTRMTIGNTFDHRQSGVRWHNPSSERGAGNLRSFIDKVTRLKNAWSDLARRGGLINEPKTTYNPVAQETVRIVDSLDEIQSVAESYSSAPNSSEHAVKLWELVGEFSGFWKPWGSTPFPVN